MPAHLLDRFILAKQSIGCTTNTISWYQGRINDYLAWCAEVEMSYEGPNSIEEYIVSLRCKGMAHSTIFGSFTALSAWFKWAMRRGMIAANPFDQLERPKQIRKIKNRVTKEEFARLYRSIEVKKWSDQRDKCLLLVMFYSGLRLTETVSLLPTDVDLDQRLIVVQHGKGNKARAVPCHPALVRELPQYLEMRPPFGSDHLFVANDGHDRVRGALGIDGLRMMLTRRWRAAGLPYRSPHAFRHAFAVEFLNSGMEMSAVAAALGHASVKTTEKEYAFWLTAGIQREYDEALTRQGVLL